MEEEIIFTGYCRCLDQNRMVTAERDGETWAVDCRYGDCPHQGSCLLAAQMDEKLK